MPVEIIFADAASVATPIPYPSCFENARTNAGFLDLRGHPELIERVHEVKKSPALQRLIERAAAQNAPIFTLGCDLGSHTDHSEKPGLPAIAGGYVQFAAKQFLLTPPKAYYGHAKFIRRHLKAVSGKRVWRLAFSLTPCVFRFSGLDEFGGSNYVAFWAFEKTADAALAVREQLIDEITTAIFHPNALKRLEASSSKTQLMWDDVGPDRSPELNM
jgi:hypothetical protein